METEIVLRISESGEITVSANGQDTPAASLDEAIGSIQAIAQEALNGGQGDTLGPENETGGGAEPTPAQMDAAEETAMVKSYKNRNPKGIL